MGKIYGFPIPIVDLTLIGIRPAALQDILEKCVRELGDLKVAPCEPCDIPTDLIGLRSPN